MHGSMEVKKPSEDSQAPPLVPTVSVDVLTPLRKVLPSLNMKGDGAQMLLSTIESCFYLLYWIKLWILNFGKKVFTTAKQPFRTHVWLW